MKLSVIIPIYNVEQYLCKALDSVVNQSYKDIEIICVNDGSTDNCKKIIEDYASRDSRVIVVNQ
jgi:glycosyltransferase involved in cell wall biosynthesis